MSSSQVKSSIFYLLGFMGMRSKDVLLASFPRSGNTWARFLLCNLISLREWGGKEVDFPLLNKTMPELGFNNLLRRWPHTTIPRVIKTHKPHLSLFRRNRSIGIIRDPRDVMVSHYHRRKHRLGRYTGTFAEFIRDRRHGLESWFRHYTSWHNHWTLVVRYEDLREDTFRELSRILNFLEVSYPELTVREAIHRSSTENVRRVESPSSVSEKKQARFVRDGQSRQWVTYFDEQDLAFHQGLVERFGAYVYADAKNRINPS